MYYQQQQYGSAGDAEDVMDDFISRLRKMFPRETQDLLAVIILFAILPCSFLFEVFAILPQFFDIFSSEWNWRVGILVTLGVSAFVNIWKMKAIGPNGPGSELPALMKPGYHYCHSCQLNEPPRSHHCPVCDRCVFRRDHHCSFVAVCVGHFNQRYYIVAVVQLLTIAVVVAVWNWSFMWSSLGGFTAVQFWQLIVPHLALIFRVITFSQFLCVMTFVFAFTVVLFLVYLISAQLFCLYNGQTRVEYLMDIHAYQLGFAENVRQAMGRRWALAFLSPFVSSPLLSDGLSFTTREAPSVSETTKTM